MDVPLPSFQRPPYNTQPTREQAHATVLRPQQRAHIIGTALERDNQTAEPIVARIV